tara:strand:- start:633 stop:1649 length:1017 start_codon:yes stop_codon:yes gene_type:complete
MLKNRTAQLLNVILPAIIGLELIILVIIMSPYSLLEIWLKIKAVVIAPNNWIWILLSMALGYLGEVLRGVRWVLLIKPLGYNVKQLDCVNSVASGYMFNAGVPRSGEIARCTLLNKVTKTPISYLFGHVLMERLIDFLILGICIASCVLYKKEIFGNYLYSLISIKSVVILIGLMFVFFLFYKLGYRALSVKMFNFLKDTLKKVKVGFYSIKKVQQKKLFFLYTILIWFCYFAMTYVCFFCFDTMSDFNIMDGIFVMTLGGIGMVIPTPSGMGSYHMTAMIALGMLSTDFTIDLSNAHPDQLSFAFLVHSAQTIMILVMGFIGLLLLNTKKSYNAKFK